MTDEEKHLWYDFLRHLPVTVNRQKRIGNYIVDFFIADKRIVIELDGSQHGSPEHQSQDRIRDSELRALGITVLRYTNTAVNKAFDNVCSDISKHLGIKFSDLPKRTISKKQTEMQSSD